MSSRRCQDDEGVSAACEVCYPYRRSDMARRLPRGARGPCLLLCQIVTVGRRCWAIQCGLSVYQYRCLWIPEGIGRAGCCENGSRCCCERTGGEGGDLCLLLGRRSCNIHHLACR